MSDRAGQARALTTFVAIRPGEEEALEGYLQGLERGPGSPLARSARTHVARWVIIDRLPSMCVPRPDRLRRNQLYFSASYDGDEASYLDELAGLLAPVIPEIWGRCENYPGIEDRGRFVAWLLEHRVVNSFFFSAYPKATVHDVRNALAAREQALAFALRTQDLGADERLQAFREAFP
jgi:hypothetical protein